LVDKKCYITKENRIDVSLENKKQLMKKLRKNQ
jgi:hypothetical protein